MHPNPNVVLVHGAWADGSSWSRVITELQQGGTAVIAAPIPLTSLDDDVNAVIPDDRSDRRTRRPGRPRVRRRRNRRHRPPHVFKPWSTFAALTPDEGETVADVFYRDAPHPQAPELRPDDERLDLAAGRRLPQCLAAHHATAEERALLATVRATYRCRVHSEAGTETQIEDIPTWFLIAEEDRMINPETQRFMAERMQANAQSHQVDHTPLITRPQVVTEILEEAVRSL